ncbi:uncharacterized protein [Anabrus simplex]|uniref:uncharacterized protein n=1 Tax=Anabrus simplex TaxID=316456 RepID=UPI0035A32164
MNYAEPEIPLYVKENAVVVYAPSPGDFVMQLSSNLDKLMALMEDIASYYNSGQGKPLTKFSLRPGTPCIARYSVDGAWYRARVESVSGNTVGVYFVDYGNQEDVPLSDVQEIMPQFMSLPAQGILCNLMGARPSEGCQWASEMSESFVEMTEGKDLQTVFMQKKGKVVDVIIDDITDPAGVSINEQFGVTFEVLRDALRALHVNTQQVPNTVSSQPLSAYKLPLFSPQTRIKVLVSWFVTPEEFYCQNLSSEKDFKNLMEEIQRSSKELSPLRGEVDIGTAVIAKFPADGVLYRGEIKEQRGAMSYLVEYVDYGNNELVSPSDLWNVEPRFHSLPRHAFLCTLEGVKPVDSNWSRNVKDYIDIFGADNLECEVSELKNGKYSVNLFLGDKSLAAELVKRNLAEELQGPESDTQFDLELLPSQQFTVHIAFIESITKFYVHLDPVVAQGIQDIVAEYVQNTQPSHTLLAQIKAQLSHYLDRIRDLLSLKLPANERQVCECLLVQFLRILDKIISLLEGNKLTNTGSEVQVSTPSETCESVNSGSASVVAQVCTLTCSASVIQESDVSNARLGSSASLSRARTPVSDSYNVSSLPVGTSINFPVVTGNSAMAQCLLSIVTQPGSYAMVQNHPPVFAPPVSSALLDCITPTQVVNALMVSQISENVSQMRLSAPIMLQANGSRDLTFCTPSFSEERPNQRYDASVTPLDPYKPFQAPPTPAFYQIFFNLPHPLATVFKGVSKFLANSVDEDISFLRFSIEFKDQAIVYNLSNDHVFQILYPHVSGALAEHIVKAISERWTVDLFHAHVHEFFIPSRALSTLVQKHCFRVQHFNESLSEYVQDIKLQAKIFRLHYSEAQMVANIIEGLL